MLEDKQKLKFKQTWKDNSTNTGVKEKMLQIFANIWSGIEHAYAYVKVITDKILSDSRWVQQCMRIQYVQHVLYYERV